MLNKKCPLKKIAVFFLLLIFCSMQIFSFPQKIEWKRDPNALEYKIEIVSKESGKKITLRSKTNLVTAELDFGSYTYRIIALDFLGRESSVSDWTELEVLKSSAPVIEKIGESTETVQVDGELVLPVKITDITGESIVELIGKSGEIIRGKIHMSKDNISQGGSETERADTVSFDEVPSGEYKIRITNPSGKTSETDFINIQEILSAKNADEKISDEKSTEENPIDEKASEENPRVENPIDEKASEENLSDEKPEDVNTDAESISDEKSVDENPVVENLPDEKSEDENPVVENLPDEKSEDENPLVENLSDENIEIENPGDEKSLDEKSVDENTEVENPSDEESLDENIEIENPAVENLHDEKSEDENPVVENPEHIESEERNRFSNLSVIFSILQCSNQIRNQIGKIKTPLETPDETKTEEENPDIENPADEKSTEENPVDEKTTEEKLETGEKKNEALSWLPIHPYYPLIMPEDFIWRRFFAGSLIRVFFPEGLAVPEEHTPYIDSIGEDVIAVEPVIKKHEEKIEEPDEKKEYVCKDLIFAVGLGAYTNPVDEKIALLSDWPIIPEVNAHLTWLPYKGKKWKLGYELSGKFFPLISTSEYHDSKIFLYTAQFNLVYQHTLFSQKSFWSLRLGGGAAIADAKINYTASQGDRQNIDENLMRLTVQAGLSIFCIPAKHFTVETGVDASLILDSDFGGIILDPYISFGLRL